MDLMSDLVKGKWENKGVPPMGTALTTKGYVVYNIFRKQEPQRKEEGIRYYMSSDGGVPCQGVLYGSDRDPLKSIGHCYMRTKVIKDTTVVTGIIIEDDYVEIVDTFLNSIKVPEPEKKENGNNVDLSLSSDLLPEKWQNKGQPPKMKTNIGYNYYNIVRETPETEAGALKYYLSTDEGLLLQALLHGSKRDPLKSIGNVYLKINKENGRQVIKGIIIDDDWVEMK